MRYLDGCLGSLAKMDCDGLDVSVLVLDNGSTDGSLAAIRAFPFVELVETGANLGTAGGYSFGMRLALERGCDYVYLLNQDTEVEPRFLVETVAAAEADPKIGAAQSLLLQWPQVGSEPLVNSAGNAIHFLGFGYSFGYLKPVAPYLGGVRDVPYCSGAGLLLRCKALREVGLMEEGYFMYHEDLDMGWKLRLAGWRNVIAPASVVWHKYEFSRSVKKYFWMERNRFIVLLGRLSARSLAVLALPLLLAEIGMILPAITGGWWREKLRVGAELLRPRTWALIRKLRAETRRIRRASDREVVAFFTPVIESQETDGTFTRFIANPLMRLTWGLVRPLIR
jgi:hypothetical protein